MKKIQFDTGDESEDRGARSYVGSVASSLQRSSEDGDSGREDENCTSDELSTIALASTSEPLPLDTLFSILSNERRRFTLHTLRNETEPIDRRDLAEIVAGLENGKDREDVTPTERKRVYVSLHQHHLPKLEDADAVVCNASKVEAGPNAEAIVAHLPGAEPTPATSTPAPKTDDGTDCASVVALVGGSVFAAGAMGLGTQTAVVGAAATVVGAAAVLRKV